MPDKINLSEDTELNTTCLKECNACVYNGRRKFDLENVTAVNNEKEKILHILFDPDEKTDAKIRIFMKHFKSSEELEAAIYPIDENGLHLAWFDGTAITVYGDDDGHSIDVEIKYFESDEITHEFTQIETPEEVIEEEKISEMVKAEVQRRKSEKSKKT